MDLFTLCPQDHKNLIYHYLNAEDLIHLGLSCKSFYRDQERMKILVENLIDDYLYANVYHVPVILNEYFKSSLYYHELVEEYFSRLKSISFDDIIRSGKTVSIQKVHRLQTFEFQKQLNEYGIRIHFSFFSHAYTWMEYDLKIKIIKQVIQYMFELWKYAERNLKCIYDTKNLHRQSEEVQSDSFEFSQLFLSLHNLLRDIFLEDLETQQFLLDQIVDLGNKTKDSKYFYILTNDYQGQNQLLVSGGYSGLDGETPCQYYSNDYDLLHFVRNLDICLTDIPTIVQVGQILRNQKYYGIHGYALSTFIAELFDEFIGAEDDNLDSIDHCELDCYAEIIIYKLQMKYDDTKTYDDILEELFYISNFNYSHFKNVLENRLKRWNKI